MSFVAETDGVDAATWSSACSPPRGAPSREPAGGGPHAVARRRARSRELARYEGLALHVRGGIGDRPGEHRLPGRSEPAGIELEAYAPYTPGDDLRHLDWSTLGRLDQLLVRRYTAEREALVHLLVDLSASMGVPADEDKLGTARTLVRVLAFIALAAGDAVRLAWLGGEAPRPTSPVLRQRAALRHVDAALDGARAVGRPRPRRGARGPRPPPPAAGRRRRGLGLHGRADRRRARRAGAPRARLRRAPSPRGRRERARPAGRPRRCPRTRRPPRRRVGRDASRPAHRRRRVRATGRS